MVLRFAELRPVHLIHNAEKHVPCPIECSMRKMLLSYVLAALLVESEVLLMTASAIHYLCLQKIVGAKHRKQTQLYILCVNSICKCAEYIFCTFSSSHHLPFSLFVAPSPPFALFYILYS